MESSIANAEVGTNTELVQGLRDLADFLEQHPELPEFSAYVHGHVYAKDAREQLEAFAAVCDSATEKAAYGSVKVVQQFTGDVSLELSATVKALGGEKVERYEYEPILGGGDDRD